jgi:hypothetical protein
MISLGNVLRNAGHQAQPDVNISDILTAPALLEGDIMIAITNKAKLIPGSFRMLATDVPIGPDQANRNITLFVENDSDLSASQIVNLTPEQGGEIMRQLAAIGHQGTRLYHVHVVTGKIDGFPYFRPEQSGEETGASQGSQAQSTEVKAEEASAPAVAPVQPAECNGTIETPPGDPVAGLMGDAIRGETVVTGGESAGSRAVDAELASKQ